MVSQFLFQLPSNIIFGPGEIKKLGREIKKFGPKAFLITGGKSLKNSGNLDRIITALKAQQISIDHFDGLGQEPEINDIERGRKKLLSSGADVVVAIGGGSVLDAGKAIAGLVYAKSPAEEYYSQRTLTQKGLPIITVPTTSGSGAEVTKNAVIISRQKKIKASIRSDYMMPETVIVDPELTLSLPPSATAYSGMDALCQGIESFVSTGANPITDAVALQSIKLCYQNLLPAYQKGEDLEARTKLALGSLMAGISLMNARLGLVHGLVHPLGALYHIPHGLGCAVLLPLIIEFNASAASQANGKYALIAKALGFSPQNDQPKFATGKLIESIHRLNDSLDIPQSWNQEKIKMEYYQKDLSTIIEAALQSGSTKHNPRQPLPEDIE